MAYKIKNENEAECITIKVTRKDYPFLFKEMVEELMELTHASESDAEDMVEGKQFWLEICYDKDKGLFCIESDKIEDLSTSLYNPYTGEHLENFD